MACNCNFSIDRLDNKLTVNDIEGDICKVLICVCEILCCQLHIVAACVCSTYSVCSGECKVIFRI